MKSVLEQILLARVYDVAFESPLKRSRKLSNRLGNNIYLKREDLQAVHSFKLRGAYNKIFRLSAAHRKKGVITVSAGNHAQGVALAAHKLKISAVIVMPLTTPQIKIDSVQSFGAEVVLYGDNFAEALEHGTKLAIKLGRTFVHPFDDNLVIAGQGTIGREIVEQKPDTTHVFVPIGGGGLIAGIAAYIKQLRPDIRVVGVEPDDSNAMQLSMQAGKRITLSHVGIFADGVAVKQVGERTFKLVTQYVDDIVTVNNDQICAAIKDVFEETRTILEPAGALGVAGATLYTQKHKLQGKNLVAVCSGANMTFEKLQFIAERTLLGSGKEALFAVTLPERAGALHFFCDQVVNGHGITEFNYRMYRRAEAHIFVGITISGNLDKQQFVRKMARHGYNYKDLSDDDVAKEHIRHMIGGPSPDISDEKLYEINFPERPGALNGFLKAIGDKWNISLFHYRGQGGDIGRVLMGFETKDHKQLEDRLKITGYDFEPVDSESARIFLT